MGIRQPSANRYNRVVYLQATMQSLLSGVKNFIEPIPLGLSHHMGAHACIQTPYSSAL